MKEKVYILKETDYKPETKEERKTMLDYVNEFSPEKHFLFFKKRRRGAFLKKFHKTYDNAKEIWIESQKPAYEKRRKGGWTQWG